jgi:hypothetical protein
MAGVAVSGTAIIEQMTSINSFIQRELAKQPNKVEESMPNPLSHQTVARRLMISPHSGNMLGPDGATDLSGPLDWLQALQIFDIRCMEAGVHRRSELIDFRCKGLY